MQSPVSPPLTTPTPTNRFRILLDLFTHWFIISLTVVGGGYAIIIVADDVFGRRLHWLKEGELMEHLPIFQTIPGLIAGNSAMYVGLKRAGILGAVVALVAVALPSLIIITLIAMLFSQLPANNPYLEGAFIGLRCALCAIVATTIIRSWRRIVKGLYAVLAIPIFTLLMVAYKIPAGRILVFAICFGILIASCLPQLARILGFNPSNPS